ncbi:cytochrome d ubiquinol oxidase subunit II [Noviherbaspirillum sp. CPCC 100848]|uniref:Cytochrome d ubiquinol oxidase subunit II n=1 Tax=Noviherbaspirillum album TaxID=3080276 RepID=A0ABU6J2M2_9BURK|nr:cytochrome d ubiquinol oxidase subunit II [Noviherbaspirillum sp. CPCC 100848]MEC4717857.1 cytochrome d ubiquinol oxidase subunit II [Noviherbaspirillum sp. CPCC 100848]
MSDTLPIILALLTGFVVAMYVVLDGFDLGIGILFPFYKKEEERDQIMNSVAPFWDGNETWLVLGGVSLWAGFPKAFAVILPALYMPVIILLLALIFRGVAFEFRWVAKPHHRLWDISFAAGSIAASFAQGVILGGLLQEITVKDQQFAGGSLDWLTPFSLMCGVAVVIGYALLGATWLMMKAVGDVEERARRFGTPLLLGLLAFIGVVSVWTPLQIERIAERWFSVPNIFFLSQIPLATALTAWLCWYGISRKRPIMPFASAVGLFLLAYLGLVISNAPYLVPPSMTIWEGASHPASQMFYLIGASILLPMILLYTVLVFWLFRGRIKPGEGYH